MDHAPEPAAHHPRSEASAVLDRGQVARVLEPSPPFDDRDPDYRADDPVREDRLEPGSRIVSPVPGADLTWDDVVGDRPDLASFARDRWLTSGRGLPSRVPDGYHEARVDLHRLAVYVLSPARLEATGKMALRATRGGFGTPFFGVDDRQVRVQDGHLVDQRDGKAEVDGITTLSAAARFVGVDLDLAKPDSFDVPSPGDPDRALTVDAEVNAFVADWYGFATRVLETVRADVPDEDRPSRVQLWPEHFDPAFEAGSEDVGRRAGFGASPGDHHDGADPEPYLYVSLWTPDAVPESPFWGESFGAKLPWADLVAASDQEAAAVAFYREARDRLRA
ncbi:MAG: hypothetical protein AAGK32_15450 [Actinomycetota bacterium]